MVVPWILSFIRRETALRRTLRVLRDLDDRDLEDIGVSRTDL